MTQLQLDPHEELDEIDRRTNDDGTVEVRLDSWEKRTNERNSDAAVVYYITPTGERKSDRMDWPTANSDSYKFIRLIEQTPYTLRTAESINEDNSLYVKAEQDLSRLHLPESKSLMEDLSDTVNSRKNSLGFEIVKYAFWPVSVLGMALALLELDAAPNPLRGSKYDNAYLDGERHTRKTIIGLKSAIITVLWILAVVALL